MKLRAGVAGSGSMGRNHARCYALIDEVELTAVFDNDLERAKAVADEFGAGGASFGGWRPDEARGACLDGETDRSKCGRGAGIGVIGR